MSLQHGKKEEQEPAMSTYEFTLRLDREIIEDQADALYGIFNDGSIMTGSGRTEIEFSRDSDSWAEAIGSAIRDVESLPELRVVGVGQEDLVSLMEIAHRTRRSREAVRLWAAGKRGPGDFPAPDWQSPSGERFWSWPDVAYWVRENFNLAIEVVPHEVHWADEVLKARHAVAEAERMLAHADDATQRQLRPFLERT
jgi:hypothetical protein